METPIGSGEEIRFFVSALVFADCLSSWCRSEVGDHY